jgi:ATP-dependent DNA helicase RecQ
MMLRYASTRECRRKLLLGYFGEAYEKDNCGSCDNCIRALADTKNEVTQIQPRAVHVPAAPVSLRSGTVVVHKKWGEGLVQTVEGGTITVHFPEVGYKTLALDLVIQSEILRFPDNPSVVS